MEGSSPAPAAAQTVRFLGRSGAILILLSLLTGFFVAAAMTGKVPADPHAALASHLNAMLGGFWILGVAWSVPLLRFEARGLQRLAWAVVIANYANWIVTALKAVWRVSGVDFVGEARNDAIFGLLTFLVVVPSIAAAAVWVYAFKPRT